MSKILIVVNYDYFFLSHRKAIARGAIEEGHDVVLMAKDTGRAKEIEDMGMRFIPMPGSPTGMNPVEELKTLKFLVDTYKKEKPDVVHHVVLKNVMWGSIASRLAKVPGVLNAVCGLGVMFNMPLGSKAYLIMKLIKWGASRKNILTIFQNNDDKQLFIDNGVVKEKECLYTKGSGVDLTEYRYVEPREKGKTVILFSGRMVEEKGVRTLTEAAAILRPTYGDRIEFRLCGALSSNPRAISKEWLEKECDGEYLKWYGDVEDMFPMLADSDIVAFPSKYREGLPKSSIEACAVGRPLVTTDSVGCRDTVEDGINGFMIPVDDSRALADKLALLIEDKELRLRMGKAGRKKAEKEFDVRHVVDVHLKAYSKLIQGK